MEKLDIIIFNQKIQIQFQMMEQKIQDNLIQHQQSLEENQQQNNISDPKKQYKSNWREYGDNLKYQFPNNLLCKKTINGKKQFSKLMKLEAQNTRSNKCWRIRYSKYIKKDKDKCKYIYVSCTRCNAKITYHEKQDLTWQLISYMNIHNHSIQNLQTYKGLVQTLIYQENNQKQKKTNLNFQKTKILFKLLKYQFKSESNLQFNQQLNFPNSLVAISLDHKQNYRFYGQTIVISISQQFFEQTNYEGQKLSLILFKGFDNNYRVLTFGFGIMRLSNNDIKNTIEWFFELMGFMNTTSIITKKDEKLIRVLYELKMENQYEYEHIFYSNFNVLKNIIINKELINDKQILEIFTKIIKQSDKYIAQQYLTQIRKILVDELNLIQQYAQIQHLIKYVCFFKMQPVFIGIIQTTQNLYSFNFKNKLCIYKFIQKITQITKQQNIYSNKIKDYVSYPYQNIYQNQIKIKEVRQKFQKKIFYQFIQKYNKSQFYQLQKFDKKKYQIKNIINQYKYQIKNQKCSCQYTQKMGIPCQHLIYYKVNIKHESLLDLFHKRWFPRNERKKRMNKI